MSGPRRTSRCIRPQRTVEYSEHQCLIAAAAGERKRSAAITTMSLPDQNTVLEAIRKAAATHGRPPSRSEFMSDSGMTEYQVLRHFPSWREAVRAAGLEANSTNQPLALETLLADWGETVRQIRRIPTRHQYRQSGSYSLGVFDKRIGSWAAVPGKFREWANGKSEWGDVIALLPIENARPEQIMAQVSVSQEPSTLSLKPIHHKLEKRPTYGNPIDFRGLRHEPINENGVVFLFGMVARELGYSVEAVQAGFPDCEAKRQVGPGKWQRVRIEFEFESRNFRDHGHPVDGCDVIVCWRHNWPDCPSHLEVLDLRSVIQSLASSED